jgi:S-disulfanyl-L-cysteine oxidoreductase SoxD
MGPFTTRLLRFALPLMLLSVSCQAAWAQSPTYGLGKAPTDDEVRAWDIAIGPNGKELPPGSGSAKEGASLYMQKCAACHGPSGAGGLAPMLIKPDAGTAAPARCLAPCINAGNVMALHSPYATTLWDYINRGMPFSKEGSLKPEEVYALTAFLLFMNGVIKEDEVLDAQSLPQVKMPNHDGYAIPEWKHGAPRPFPNKP